MRKDILIDPYIDVVISHQYHISGHLKVTVPLTKLNQRSEYLQKNSIGTFKTTGIETLEKFQRVTRSTEEEPAR